MNNILALIINRTSTREPHIVTIDTDNLTTLLGGTAHALHGYRERHGIIVTLPQTQFHINVDQQLHASDADINELATNLWLHNNNATAQPARLNVDTLYVTGHNPHTGAAADVPEYIIDAYAAIADHLD